jgi:hypothetical protein
MPKNHGLTTDSRGIRYFRFGIKSTMRLLTQPPFVESAHRFITTQDATYALPSLAFEAFDFHLSHALTRLLHSLDLFQRGMANLAHYYSLTCDPRVLSEALNASIAADSILHYLNIVVDDIAKLTPFVMNTTEPSTFYDGFSKLRSDMVRCEVIPPFSTGARSRTVTQPWPGAALG